MNNTITKPLLFLSLMFTLTCLGVVVYMSMIPQKIKKTEVEVDKYSGYTHRVNINGQQVYVEVADTEKTREQGLSGKEKLDEGTGMLFIFPTSQMVTFWMPDMNFPIDIIFIDKGEITNIAENVPNPPKDTPKEQLARYPSEREIDMVLEVPALWSQKHGITKGMKVEFEKRK